MNVNRSLDKNKVKAPTITKITGSDEETWKLKNAVGLSVKHYINKRQNK